MLDAQIRPDRPRRRVISIVGGRAENVRDVRALELARLTAAVLGEQGFVIATGGDSGVGESALRGVADVGGESVVFLKEEDCDRYDGLATICVPTGVRLARSLPLNWAAEHVVAFDGGFGTLFEIAMAIDTEKPITICGIPRHLDMTEAGQLPWVNWLPELDSRLPGRVLQVVGDAARVNGAALEGLPR
jgi:uncharacterized protein (TIGR00725 family)